jgi:biopolymer transport protein ExbB
MRMPDFKELGPLLEYLSGLSTQVILVAAVFHFLFFFWLWVWYRRDLRVIASTLEDFTRGIKHRSIIGRASPLGTQIDAFVADIQDVLSDDERKEDRQACLLRLHILDEKRSYLDSLSFETAHNIARTMIEAYPLAGVLGTILAIGSALQRSGDGSAAQSMNTIVSRFGDAIWSTFAGLCAAMLLMFINSFLETRFERLTDSRTHVRDVVAKAKRELGLDVSRRKEPSSP